ncbi:hypothetical protein K435DRAFT_802200 [Dendrothele bispora CBS 962.96]|uniref:Uncharacterized protein n=1 Tax=Dendrothele bispora (strain CBS 962.96) TaxID=1314807 RepID=A0A4S8LM97_DENBC|nr:hypothetical protein K435DRAFT_802200 [Dendrothele bispora CBS 962.96]
MPEIDDFWSDHDINKPPPKRQKTSNDDGSEESGNKGSKHLWGELDNWFMKHIKIYEDNFNADGWKVYMQETIELDIQFYSPLVEDITPATDGPSLATGSPNIFTFQPSVNAPVFSTTGAMGSALLR